ncbi:3-oxoacyl-ACP synthase [Streptomyces sp. AV19]|uniref:beta-ketoacyl synthase N-terminal-like domain-containing protein n=1 Tax=Streptomyces sp. AV19 TaxID=2793068 RepID=UPI0018FED2F0|nr:beta-ketoacyl synthase N-terminal-like domain-containing protein [Streptomyces sp. AV19]MBH1934183.1 3-oxoacyl-ACP synthase [Streptomyces sp. AV19]MDG4533554.1 3-oxoacyl-ACP synthase [Streptomyces sp. AV19]
MNGNGLVVTGIGVVSPRGGDPAALDLEGAAPADDAWFDVAAELGPRGYKYVPPSCRYLLAATRRAVVDAGDPLAGVPEAERGMALGTNSGIAALTDAMDATVTGPGAERLSPATAPYFSINTLAGRVAMAHGVKGWNLTLTSPRTAGLETLLAGARAVAAGRSMLLLAGSTEAARPAHRPARSGSEAGAVVFVLEPRPRAAAHYGTCRTVTFSLPAAEQRLEELLTRFLKNAPAPEAALLITDTFPLASALAEHLRHRVGVAADTVPAPAGTLLPMLHLSRALSRPGPPRLLAAISSPGSCALTLVHPRQPPDDTKESA